MGYSLCKSGQQGPLGDAPLDVEQTIQTAATT
jgi:hypothetical protein